MRAARLLMDDGNPFIKRPNPCHFQMKGNTGLLTLNWQKANIDQPQKAYWKPVPGNAGYGVRAVGGGYWVSMEALDPKARRHQIDHPDRPNAFIAPNLVLLHNCCLDTGTINQARVAHMFSQPMQVPAVQGVMGEHEIMPLSAWPQIQALSNLPDPGGHPRSRNAGHRIGQMLAAGPAQLHDPKSPAGKKARSYMRQSMSPRWLAGGLAVEAMNWLQTFEWREGESSLSPRETMLRAYAYMPDVDPPPNIKIEAEKLNKLVV